MDFVAKVKKFNEIGGTLPIKDDRKLGLYTGLVFEELSEMIESFGDEEFNSVQKFLSDMADMFKKGQYDACFATESFDREAYLDAAVDIAVVSLGAGISVGADIEGATNEVADNNLSKFNYDESSNTYTVLKDDNGKIQKPKNYQPVSLKEYLV